MSSPRPWSDSKGEVNTASRIEVRERDESANDLDQGDQQNQNTTNARHTETTGEGSAVVRGWVPRWGQRQILLGPVEPVDNEWRTAWGEDSTLEVRTRLGTRTLHTSARSSERWRGAERVKYRCWRNCLSWSEGK